MPSFLILDIAFYSLRVMCSLSYVKIRLLAKGFLDPFRIDRTGIYYNFFYYSFVLLKKFILNLKEPGIWFLHSFVLRNL